MTMVVMILVKETAAMALFSFGREQIAASSKHVSSWAWTLILK